MKVFNDPQKDELYEAAVEKVKFMDMSDGHTVADTSLVAALTTVIEAFKAGIKNSSHCHSACYEGLFMLHQVRQRAKDSEDAQAKKDE